MRLGPTGLYVFGPVTLPHFVGNKRWRFSLNLGGQSEDAGHDCLLVHGKRVLANNGGSSLTAF